MNAPPKSIPPPLPEKTPDEPIPADAVPPMADDFIKSRIFTVRGVQVMLDRDLAALYGVEVKHLNRQVKRNIERFPPDFMFQLSRDEGSRCQFGTLNAGRGQNLKYVPYAFTENGIAMLSGVLRSPTAIEINIRIMRVFNAMRRALASMAPLLARLAETERRQLEDRTRQIADQARNEERFDTIFQAMDGGDFPPQKVFFADRHYDAFSFARKLVRKAAESIVLVDNYCDDTTLDILAQKRGGASVTVATTAKSAAKFLTPAAVAKFNRQNPPLAVKTAAAFHDRFLILDGADLYHFGASLKDLGRQYCAVTKMDPMFIPSILQRL
jgi:phage regulator Rha-like protein